MAIRQKEKKKAPVKIEEIINKGGSSIKENRSSSNGDIKRMTLRLFTDLSDRINSLRETRTGSQKVSLHGWILEAIAEKLDRDERKAKS